MDRLEPHWWAIVVAAITGFLGWRIKSAQDSVQIQNMREKLTEVSARLESLETSRSASASDLARLHERLDGIGRTLERLEQTLDRRTGQ